MVCIVYQKNNQNIKLYINSKIILNNVLPEKISKDNFRHTNYTIKSPNFVENMNIHLGEDNF